MSSLATTRSYSLTGPDSLVAVERGLAAAEWYKPDIPRQVMKDLMKREDGPALRDTAIWLACLLVVGAGAWMTWGSLWCIPFFFVYGVLYGSANDARWHEAGHGTAFRTPWMNQVVYQVASFATLREPEVWRWSHSRHHTDTIIVGRDPEIAAMRPPHIAKLLLGFFAIPHAKAAITSVFKHALGQRGAEEATYLPDHTWPSIFRTARIWLAIYAALIATAVLTQSVLPVLFIGPLPTMYGAWLAHFFGLTQHAGLAEDVLDHRLNARTVLMNPVSRFLYWNMNYHLEHHMFPMVPYYRLPALHAVIKDDLPPASPSTLAAWREILDALKRQRTDPAYFIRRELPPTAKPFRAELHGLEIARARSS
jgi:fatty acid desaturase